MNSPSSTSTQPIKLSSQPRRSLGTVLLLVFVALALVPVIVLTSLSAVVQANLARDSAFDRMAGVTAAKTQQIEGWIASSESALLLNLSDQPSYENAVTILAAEAETETGPASQDFDTHAQLFLQPNGPFNRIMLADATGTVVFSTDPAAEDWDVSGSSFFQDGRFQLNVATPIEDPIDDELSIYFSTPVTDADGSLLGVLVGRTPTDALVGLASERTGLGETGEIQLVTPSGAFLNTLRFSDEEATAGSVGVSRALSGVDGQAAYRDYRGEPVLGVYRWLPDLGIALIAKQDTSEALAASRALVLTNVLTAVRAALAALGLGFFFVRRITRPIADLTDTAVRIASGDRSLRVESGRADELGALASAFNEMSERVESMVGNLEDRVAERTRDLETTAEISRTISAVRDLDVLLPQVTDLIRERYGHYHVQIFLVDDVREYAVLRSSTGDLGEQLLARGHKLPVGSQSVIGQATGGTEFVVARDTDTSSVYQRNELLPNTRSELALPLVVGDEIIGALDVQSVKADAFDERSIDVLRSVADQVSIAINNARLFEESQGLLREQMKLSQLLTREGWEDFLAQQSDSAGYTYDLAQVRPSEDEEDTSEGDGLRAAIQLRGETIGELFSIPDEGRQWDDEDRLLVEAVAERVALALENARLFEQTQSSLQEVGRLYDAARAIVEADALDELLKAILESAIRDWVGRVAVVLVNNADIGFARSGAQIRAEWRPATDAAYGLRVPLNQAGLPMLAEMGSQVRVINDIQGDPTLDMTSTETLSSLGHTAGIYLPLLGSAGQPLGWLMVAASDGARSFVEDEVRYFRTLADQAGTAVDGHRLLEQTQARARKLQATNAVSQAATSILDLNALLPQAVEHIRDNFDYYHAQVFLVDEESGDAVLRASTGVVGQELIARGHRLPVGSQSVIGQVTREGVPVIARDTDADPIHRQNELLPETRAEMAIPLQRAGKIIGALDVQSTRPFAFEEEDIAILQTLADQLSVALENAQLFQDVQERVAELTTVNLISQEVSHAQTLDGLFETVSAQMVHAFEAPNGFLALYDRRADRVHYPIWLEHGEQEAVEGGPLTPGPVARIIQTGVPLMLNEMASEAVRAMGGDAGSFHARSWLGVPLTIGNEVIGVLGIQDVRREGAYDDSDQRMLSTLAAYLAVAVRNAQLFEETQQRAAELGFLYDVTSAALETTELDQTLQRIAESMLQKLDGADATIVALLDRRGERLVGRAAAGYGREIIAEVGGSVPVGEGLVGWVVENRQPILVSDVREDPRYMAASPKTMSEVVVPLVLGDEVVGVLDVESTQLDAFDEDDLRLLQTLSGSLSAIIQNAQLLLEIQAANDQLRELDQMKTQFLANMSHELRTPLNSIIGFSRVILKGIDGPLTELQEQDLQTIYASGQHLLGLINDVLDMSKIEAGKLDLTLESIHLEEVVESVMSTAAGLVSDSPVELVSDIDRDLPAVYADPMRIRQVLLNLLSNAAKFTHAGNITVRARAIDETEAEPAHVLISVQDSGIGINKEDAGNLFEAFSQVDASTTREAGGTGLGLSISRSLVDLHNGRIWVESEVGVGSTFSFTIPLHPQPTQMEPIPDLALDLGDKPVVLAVDDDESVLKLYRRYVESEGMALVGLTSGHNVLEAARQVEPVAVILDVMMPERDGWEVIADLKLNPLTKDIPVILGTIVEERERAFRLGAADYLVKPIMKDDMVAALRRLRPDEPMLDEDDSYAVQEGHDEPVSLGEPDEHDAQDRHDEPVSLDEPDEYDAQDRHDEPVRLDEQREHDDYDRPDEQEVRDEEADRDRQDIRDGDNGHIEAPVQMEVVREEPLARPENGRRVLIIDDDEQLTDLVREGLQGNGDYAVHSVVNGQAGLEAIAEEKPDLIVLNLMMPDIDGFQVLARLDDNPAWRDIPVVLLTAQDLAPEDYDRLTDQAVSMINTQSRDQRELQDTITHAVTSM